MSIGLIFWILMLFWLVGIVLSDNWRSPALGPYGVWGNSLFLFVLLLLLGWHAFGSPIHS
jgi:hypothetical protein